MRRYDHVFFDLDHTLWDFDTNARESLSELYTEFSLDRTLTPDFDAFYERYIKHNTLLWERFQKGFISAEELKWKRMWRTLLDFKSGDEEMAREMSRRFLEILPLKENLFPHTREILQYLTDKGYILHLITNGFEKTQHSKLRHSRIDGYFREVVTSEASQSMKPEKAIFEYAMRKAGTRPEASLMVGDNTEADIRGAQGAGMDSIWVNHLGVKSDVTPTHEVLHLKELERLL